MIDEDLKEFLINIPHLPIDLVVKFGLAHDSELNHENDVQTKDMECYK
jgi:hypothetical protein